MATSGRMQGNSISIGGYGGQYYFIDWQMTGQNIGGNYSSINWQAYFHYQSADAQLDNGNADLNGGRWSNGGRVKNYAGTFTTRNHQVASGSFDLGHNSAGAQDINVSGGITAYQSGRSSGSQSWSLPTIPRHATLTALSTDQGGIPFTDEGPAWVEFSNPAGTAVDAFLEVVGTPGRVYTSGPIGSRFNFPFTTAVINSLQSRLQNSNSGTVRIGIHDSLGGDNWDFRDRPFTIKNNNGQADPTFSNFIYKDTNSATVAVTGSDQILIQNKSTLQATVPVVDRATANKQATMKTYGFTVGGYSASSNWSNTSDVVHNVGVVSDVSGLQNLSVRAIDSRGNSKIVTKQVNILPYTSPGFYGGMTINYSNDFDVSDGITVELFNNNVLGSVSPLTLSGADINEVNELSFDMAKDTGAYTGTPVNIAFTQVAGTGEITIDAETLATAIETKMNGMTADNTVRWHIIFKITDKLETQYFTVTIDVGRPFFRIGADGRLYYKEIEFFDTFSGRSDQYYPSVQAYPRSGSGWARSSADGFIGGWSTLINNPGTNGASWQMSVYIPAGVYIFDFYMIGTPSGARIDFSVSETTPLLTAFDTYNSGGTIEKVGSTPAFNVLDGSTYTIVGKTNGRNPANTTGYLNGLLSIVCRRVGNL